MIYQGCPCCVFSAKLARRERPPDYKNNDGKKQVMASLGTISGAALQQYIVSARTLGLDTDAALRHAAISAEEAAEPDSRIPGEKLEQMLNWMIEISGDPLFGLHTSQFVQPGSYNVMGYIAMSASSLHEALSRVALYEKLVGDMGTTETILRDGLVEIRWNCRHHTQPARRHLIENVLGSWVRYSRWLANQETLSPTLVLLEHSPPQNLALLNDYEQVFRCEIRFNQDCSALVAPMNVLMHKLRQPDPHLLSTLEAHAARKLASLGIETTLAQKVRDIIRETIDTRLPRKEQVADQLGMNIRTLHRRLLEEGTTWQEILDNLRQEMALGYLRDTRLAQADIAEKLGYADIRSFQRNFKRQNGITPGEFRRRQQTG